MLSLIKSLSKFFMFCIRISVLFVLSVYAAQASAQSMSILGGSALAQDCFDAASLAAMEQYSSYSDIETCDNALARGQLNQRDLIATYVNRGIIYAALEKYDLAQSDYRRAMNMDRFEPATYLNRGNLWFLAEQYDRAIEDYTASMDLNLHKRHVAYLNRGMAYEAIGNLQMAKDDYQASLTLRPEWQMAQDKLARLEQKLTN